MTSSKTDLQHQEIFSTAEVFASINDYLARFSFDARELFIFYEMILQLLLTKEKVIFSSESSVAICERTLEEKSFNVMKDFDNCLAKFAANGFIERQSELDSYVLSKNFLNFLFEDLSYRRRSKYKQTISEGFQFDVQGLCLCSIHRCIKREIFLNAKVYTEENSPLR